MYGDIQDISPPPIHFLNALTIFVSQISGWPIIFAFNFLTSLFALFSGWLLGATGSQPYRILTGALWVAVLLLAAHEYFFGQREYMFVLAWVPYLAARCGSEKPPRWMMIASGIFLGFMICLKPHFAIIVGSVEALLWIRFRSETRLEPFIAFIVCGAVQVLIFFLFFDVHAFFQDIFANSSYYVVLGSRYSDVALSVVRSKAVWVTVFGCALALGSVLLRGRLRPFVEATIVTVLSSAVVWILQGPRPYYFIPMYLPVIAMLIVIACHSAAEGMSPVADDVNGSANEVVTRWRVLLTNPLMLAIAALLVSLFFIWSLTTGVGLRTWERYGRGRQVDFVGSPQSNDPFVAWVQAHVPPHDNFSVIAPQYGEAFGDPFVSMLRLRRVLFSASNGLEIPFSLAEAVGSQRGACEALGLMRHDIVSSNSEWVIIRREMPDWASAQGNDPLVHFQRYPSFWDWFSAHYAHVDQFGRYTVYRRIAGTGGDGAGALRCP